MASYLNGYPHRVIRDYRKGQRNELIGCGLLLVLTLIPVTLMLWSMVPVVKYYDRPIIGYLSVIIFGLGFIFLSFCALTYVLGLIRMSFEAFANLISPKETDWTPVLKASRIVPYFEKPIGLGWVDTAASSGYALSSHCEELDGVATKIGVMPLVELGLNDDLKGKTADWRYAGEGLRTLEALICELEAKNILGEELGRTVEDLKKIKQALQAANLKNVRFCLLVRRGDDSRVEPPGELNRNGYFQ